MAVALLIKSKEDEFMHLLQSRDTDEHYKVVQIIDPS